MSSYNCSICNIKLEKVKRYPRYICQKCVSKATDITGRRLIFSNADYSGGFIAVYEDAKEIYDSHICYVENIKCFADEARFGGIVVEKMEDL